MTDTGACKAYQSTFRGWDAYFLENEYVRVVAVPDIGGRIMAYDLGDFPYIYVEPEWEGQLFSPEENQGDGFPFHFFAPFIQHEGKVITNHYKQNAHLPYDRRAMIRAKLLLNQLTKSW